MENPGIPDTGNCWTGSRSLHMLVSHGDIEYNPIGCNGDCARLEAEPALDNPHMEFEECNATHKHAALTSCFYCIQ